MISFIDIYVYTILISLIPITYIIAGNQALRKTCNHLLILMSCFLFGLVAFRTSGADLNTYQLEYASGGSGILDYGYLLIMRLGKNTELPFPIFLFICNIFVLYSIFTVAHKMKVSPGFALFVYILHLFIVRDLAHLRTSLAIAFIFVGFCSKTWLKLILYGIGFTVHASVLPLVSVLLISGLLQRWVIENFKLIILLLIPIGLLAQNSVVFFLEMISNVSVRARVYGKLYQQENELGLTLIYFLIITVLFWLMLPKKESDSLIAKTLSINVSGLYFYTIFGGIPEIGPRVFNVLMSFYPMQLAYILDLYYKSHGGAQLKTSSSFLMSRAVRGSFLIMLIIPLIIRPDTYSLLEKISFN